MVEASPEAEDLADEHDIDLGTISGSGKDGRVLVNDVRHVVDAMQHWSKYVVKDEWAGKTKYVCTISPYETLDKQRMQQHLVALDREGKIPDDKEGDE